jgi:hypothetical protein
VAKGKTNNKSKASPGVAMQEWDPTPYVRPPIIDTTVGYGLACALISAASKGAPAPVQKAAKTLHQAT